MALAPKRAAVALRRFRMHTSNILISKSLLAMAVSAALLASAPAVAEESGRSFEIYGFAQADYIQDFDGRLDPDWDDAFRPSKIGIDEQFGSDGQSSISVKQSRFGVKGSMPTGEGGTPLNFKFEFDLFGTGADAGQTTFRLRHAYGEWGALLAGQTNSLFMDGDVFPNTIDYWGPAGMVFYRNVQIRYTPFKSEHSHFSIAIERPGNDIDSGNLRLIEGFEDVQVQNDETLPDLTAQYRYGGDWGHLQFGGILRKVGFEVRETPDDRWQSGSETGWGINVGSAINTFGSDKILLQFVYGEGIASYMNDGGMDLAPTASFGETAVTDVEAEAIPLTGVVAYYDHYWTPKWSSSIGYSYTEVDNTNFQAADTFNKGEYASVNLLHYPADNLMFGGEFLYGRRTNNDGADGDDMRFQFTAKYSFGTKL
jgi:DcaP outer membrane protein